MRRPGARRSISHAAAGRCATFSFTTLFTGSRNSTSTACGSMPCMRSLMTRRGHILLRARRNGARGGRRGAERHVHLVLENDDNKRDIWSAGADGRPRWYVAQWNDDIHHACHVLATGERTGYYGDYADAPMRIVSAARSRKGSPIRARARPTVAASRVANRAHTCRRPHSCPFCKTMIRSATAPLASASACSRRPRRCGRLPPFCCLRRRRRFCSWARNGTRRSRFRSFATSVPISPTRCVRAGAVSLRAFPNFATNRPASRIPDPLADATFESAVLDWQDIAAPQRHDRLSYYRQLLMLRRREIVPRLHGLGGHAGGYELHGAHGLIAWWRLGDGTRLSLVANLGPEPLAPAPPIPPGRPIFATHSPILDAATREGWPGWSVAWSIDADDERKTA